MTQHPTPSQDTPNRGPNLGRWLHAWFTTASLPPLLCHPAHATTIWTKASEVMKDVYTQILGISTIAAVVTAAVALLMINFGHTDRSTQEARSWLKRIIITWMILNSLGFIMAHITPFFSGGQWTPSLTHGHLRRHRRVDRGTSHAWPGSDQHLSFGRTGL